MNKVLVTGANGFVGKHLIKQLDELKVSIRLLSRKNLLNYETIICDFEHELLPYSALESIDTVIHLAAYTHETNDDSKNTGIYKLINVDFTTQLAQLSRKAGVKRFIYLSSVKAGGKSIENNCSNENEQNEPKGEYAKSKRAAEINLLEIAKDSNMNVSIIRSSLVYGPNVKGNLSIMLSGISQGWFPPIPEVSNKRSMIHIHDLVRGIIFVINNKKTYGEIFIATDGKTYSSREIYNAMCQILDKPIPRWSIPKFLLDIASYTSKTNKNKIYKLLGDECYSSAKLNSLGFKANKSLGDINETGF